MALLLWLTALNINFSTYIGFFENRIVYFRHWKDFRWRETDRGFVGKRMFHPDSYPLVQEPRVGRIPETSGTLFYLTLQLR